MCRRPSASGQRLSEVIFPKDFQSDNPDRDYILDMIPMALAQEHHHPVVNPLFPLYVLTESRTVLLLVVWLWKMPPRFHISPRESSLLVPRYYNSKTAVSQPLASLYRRSFASLPDSHNAQSTNFFNKTTVSYSTHIPHYCH
jgi:hypothetical protein